MNRCERYLQGESGTGDLVIGYGGSEGMGKVRTYFQAQHMEPMQREEETIRDHPWSWGGGVELKMLEDTW